MQDGCRHGASRVWQAQHVDWWMDSLLWREVPLGQVLFVHELPSWQCWPICGLLLILTRSAWQNNKLQTKMVVLLGHTVKLD